MTSYWRWAAIPTIRLVFFESSWQSLYVNMRYSTQSTSAQIAQWAAARPSEIASRSNFLFLLHQVLCYTRQLCSIDLDCESHKSSRDPSLCETFFDSSLFWIWQKWLSISLHWSPLSYETRNSWIIFVSFSRDVLLLLLLLLLFLTEWEVANGQIDQLPVFSIIACVDRKWFICCLFFEVESAVSV